MASLWRRYGVAAVSPWRRHSDAVTPQQRRGIGPGVAAASPRRWPGRRGVTMASPHVALASLQRQCDAAVASRRHRGEAGAAIHTLEALSIQTCLDGPKHIQYYYRHLT